MGRWIWAALVGMAVAMSGCATTKLVQRDGCWVRQTETFPKTIHEEIGPCARKEPRWSNDRVARLVQECMAEADYRWQTQALAAFSRGQPMPELKSEQTIMEGCMTHASTSLVNENELLKRRLAELTTERDSLQASAQSERERQQILQERMTDALGEAAKKPAPSAFATSTSNGTATTDSKQTSSSEARPTAHAAPIPVAPMTAPPTIPAPVIAPLPTVTPVETAPTTKPSAPQGCAYPRKKGAAVKPSCNPPGAEVATQEPPSGAAR